MKKNVLFYAKLMCLSYILTALLVLIFSFIVYKNYMSEIMKNRTISDKNPGYYGRVKVINNYSAVTAGYYSLA